MVHCSGEASEMNRSSVKYSVCIIRIIVKVRLRSYFVSKWRREIKYRVVAAKSNEMRWHIFIFNWPRPNSIKSI